MATASVLLMYNGFDMMTDNLFLLLTRKNGKKEKICVKNDISTMNFPKMKPHTHTQLLAPPYIFLFFSHTLLASSSALSRARFSRAPRVRASERA